MQEILFLFSTQRAIKQFYAGFCEGVLPQAQTLGEFFTEIVCIKDKIKIPSYLRALFLHDAICENKDSNLGDFGVNFTEFLDNSSFFLSFFDELCAGCLAIDSLKNSDTYAFYDDHLNLLDRIHKSYLKKLNQNNFYSHPFVEDYFLALELLSSFSTIKINVDGFLSHFEMKILKEISKKIPIEFHIEINPYNQGYYQKLWGIALENGLCVALLQDEKMEILEYKGTRDGFVKIYLATYKDKITQSGGIFLQLDKWLNSGVELEEICVVLPNEDFSAYLKLFDKGRNFNYAMGNKLSQSEVFLKLEKGDFSNFLEVKEFLENLKEEELSIFEKKAKEKIEHILEDFSFVLKRDFSFAFESLFVIFLERLRGEKIDDVGGGRISVIGILETRGMDFKYVILPEFNEGNVPKISDKDIFLNTSIRKKVGLPSKGDRENLQKHYYLELFKGSKEVFITSIENDEIEPSRFLLDDRIFNNSIKVENENAAQSYFFSGAKLEYQEREIIAPMEIGSFSYSSLKDFMTCKRRYYYRYIKKFKDSYGEDEFNLGSLIHKILCEVYQKYSLDILKQDLQDLVFEELDAFVSLETLKQKDIFAIRMAKRYLQSFFAQEREHLAKGWIPSFFEKEFVFFVEDFSFKARIDRIDRRDDAFLILDYKYKKNLKLSEDDLQLLLYCMALNSETKGQKIESALYDLHNGVLIKEDKLIEKENLLKEVLCEIRQDSQAMNFSKCEKKEACKYCAYKYLCNRY